MVIDGRALAEERKKDIQMQVARIASPVSLGVVLSSGDKVTESFVRIKKKVAETVGVTVAEYFLSESPTEAEVTEAVGRASAHTGVIVQLPISKHISTRFVQDAIPYEKDVDGISTKAVEHFARGDSLVTPPVVAAIDFLLKHFSISVVDKKVVVVGKGLLVGSPARTFFEVSGANVVTLERGDALEPHTASADIIVLGAGSPGILKPDMVREGVVIFDAGTSESEGVVVGDADPACAEKTALFTPVPGGIGPIAVAEIFGNLVKLAQHNAA